jgi:hypothetical protein
MRTDGVFGSSIRKTLIRALDRKNSSYAVLFGLHS